MFDVHSVSSGNMGRQRERAREKEKQTPRDFGWERISVITLEHPHGISSGGCPWGKEGCDQVPGTAGNT